MNQLLENLKEAASTLPLRERAELAQFLLQSLDEDVEEVDEQSIRAEWIALAQQRMAEVDAGKAVGIPAEEFFKRLSERRN